MTKTDEIPLSTTAERQVVVSSAGQAPGGEWVIVTRGLKREYDMGGEIVRALRGVDLAVRAHDLAAGTVDVAQRGAAQRQLAQRRQVARLEIMLEGALRLLADIDLALGEPLEQFVGRQIDQHGRLEPEDH